MTHPVYFKTEDVKRVYGHGFPVFIAKDCGVYLITWDQSKPTEKYVDMACGYLADGFYLEEISPGDPRETGQPEFGEIWDASRSAVGGDDFCDEVASPLVTYKEGMDRLAIHVKEDVIEMWWVK